MTHALWFGYAIYIIIRVSASKEIAKDLNLSRPTVSRVLALAREQGIVKISISNVDAVEHWELERKLEKEYGLQEVIIVGENSSEDKMKEALGEARTDIWSIQLRTGIPWEFLWVLPYMKLFPM